MNTRTASTLILLFFSLLSVAQTPEWKYMYKGNKAFENKDFQKAERHYLNVLKENPKSVEALFNLGNTQLGLYNELAAILTAIEYYEKVKECSADSSLNAMTHHNMGYMFQAYAMSTTEEYERQQHLRLAIEQYKQALRINPHDDNTRYNLALCQKLLKDSMQQSQNEQQKQDNQDQQEQQQNEQGEQQKQQDTPQDPKEDKQMQQLLNLAKQAEKRTKEKVDKAMKNRRQKGLEKYW